MEKDCEDFLRDFGVLSEYLDKALKDELAYWQPQKPPLTALFGGLGRAFAEHFDSLDDRTRIKAVNMIENAISRGSDQLGTVVATGLIESMVGRAWKKGNWRNIRQLLGESSRNHADAWANG